MSTHIQRLYEHLAWADSRTFEALRGMHAQPLDALRIFSHLLAAEHVWLARIEGRASEMGVWPSFGLDECVALAGRNHAAFAVLAETTTPVGLQRDVRYRSTEGAEFVDTVENILLHVALHGAYHRGQVARIVRSEGGMPLYTDYIRFVREVLARGTTA
ncbi:MAG TPA: DinB family protein [Gemmatimonadaceae bacterium]|nr:DinB family protein [Gemmatimonadaceae bacterium]